VTTGSSFRAKRLVTRLMILAVFAMMLGQVVVMPSVALSSDEGSSGQHPSLTQVSLQQEASGLPCHHDGSARDLHCCFAGYCVMLTLALPVAPLAVLPTGFRLLAYRAAALRSPDGAGAAPLLPPPRYPV
jgi:hypothetical protein